MTEEVDRLTKQLAETFIANAQDFAQQLDYSWRSVKVLERFIDTLVSTGDPIHEEVQWSRGCYLGEVLVRNLDAGWVMVEDANGQPEFGCPGIRWSRFPWLKFRSASRSEESTASFFSAERVGRQRRWTRTLWNVDGDAS